MTKSNGIASLKQAARLLNKHSPDGESLAYINPEEARVLRARGGSGIMTLAGVPSYDQKWYEKLWEGVTDVAGWVGENIFGYGDQTVLDKSGKAVQVAGRSPFQDAISIYAFLRAKKDQEGLSAAEMSEFNRLNAQLTAGRKEFKEYTGGGEQLKAPEYVTTPKAVFSETTGRPDMITTPIATPAEGGRIGAFNGGIQGLMPQQGFMPQPGLMPQQGLNPRMGYAFGEQVTEEVTPFSKIPPNIKMADLDDIPDWWLTDFEELIQAFRQDNNGQSPRNLNDLEKWHRFKYGKAQGPNIEEMLNIGVTDQNTNPQEVEQLLGSMQAAQGGRIGAQGGGIMPLLDMGGMEKDYRQDGGFVPIGRREKADDVPARLSKNEFVFTADAVKAAGGGDIDEGAQRMYNVMKNLEAGGEISEQSQGQA